MYPRNAASPERIAVGAVVQISDGAVQTSGVSVKVMPQGGSASAGGGTIAYEEGVVHYLPTQAETNYTSFMVIAYKTGCIPVATTVITTASATSGTVVLAGVTHTGAVVPTVTTLTGHTPQTGDSFARLGAPAGASVSADVAAVKAQTAAIETDTQDIQTRLPAALVSGRMDSSVGAMATGVLTATAIAADAFTAAKFAADVTTEFQAGLATAAALTTVDTVVDGIAATLGSAGAGLTAIPWNAAWDAEVQSEAADALAAYGAATASDVTTAAANVSVDEIQATALADLFNTNSGTTYASAVAGSVVKEIVDNAGGSGLTAGAIADAVWDEALSGHLTAGSTGQALNAAGAAGDPWITALPGSYTAGQAGYILGTNLNATISSRLATAGYTAPLDATGTRSALGLASANLDTQLSAAATVTAGSIRSAVGLSSANLDAQIGAIDDYLDTEIGAIKAKTDLIPAAPAAVSDIPTANENADALLARDIGSGSNAGTLNERTVRSALRFVRNKWSVSGTTLTVTKEDDAASAWTATVTAAPGADPISGNDPT